MPPFTRNFFRDQRDEIVAAWERVAAAGRSDVKLTGSALRDHLPELLEELARWWEGAQQAGSPAMQSAAVRRSAAQLDDANQLRRLVSELGLLRTTILRLAAEDGRASEPGAGDAPEGAGLAEVARLSAGLDHAMADVVEEFVTRNDAHRRKAEDGLTRRAEEAVARSEAVLAQAGAMAHLGAWWTDVRRPDDVESYPLHWSDEVYRIFGYEPGQVEVSTALFFHHVHPADRQRVRDGFQHAFRTNEPYQLEHRIVRSDGAERIVLEHATAELDDDGRTRAMVGAVQDITEQKRAQDALRASEERFRALVSASSDAVYRMSADWRELRQLHGHRGFLPDAEAPTTTWMEKYLHPDDHRRVQDAVDEAMRTGGIFEMEHRVLRVGGSVGWTLSRAIPVKDATGTIVEWFGAASDITERKRAEEALRHAAELLDLGDAFWELDQDWRIVRVNANSEKLSRRSRSELLGRVHWEVFPSPPESKYWREYHRCMRERMPVQFDEYYAPLDLWTNVTAYPVSTGGIAVYFRDIAAQKRAEMALRGSEARFRTLFATMAEGFSLIEVILDANGKARDIRYLEVNPAFERHIGLRAADVVGKTLRELFPGTEPEWFDQYGGVASTGEPAHFEAAFGPLGKWFDVSAYRTEPRRLAVVFFEVTERKQALDALRESDRRKDEFLGMLSHELRNPLAPIRNSIHLLERAKPGTEVAQRAREVIRRQTDHLTRLVDDLLDVTRIARGKIELRRSRVDLREVVSRGVEDFRLLFQDHAVALDVVVPDAKIWVDADPTRITQVIGNLLNNSLKFTRRGDSVTLTLEPANAYAEIRVRDTGAGIEPPLQPLVFEPFVQGERTLARTEGGLGLGLALVKGVIELHGGTVRVESAGMGYGAEFLVRLPLEGTAAAAANRPADESAR
jgi:PAS domain S-box-containing protein